MGQVDSIRADPNWVLFWNNAICSAFDWSKPVPVSIVAYYFIIRYLAPDSLEIFQSYYYSVPFEADEPKRFHIKVGYSRYFPKFSRPNHHSTIAISSYNNFYFLGNRFLSFLAFSFNTEIHADWQWEYYILHAAKNICVDAHIFLAENYYWAKSWNEKEMNRRLRTAWDVGHSLARNIYHWLFELAESVSTEDMFVDGWGNENQTLKRRIPNPTSLKEDQLYLKRKVLFAFQRIQISEADKFILFGNRFGSHPDSRPQYAEPFLYRTWSTENVTWSEPPDSSHSCRHSLDHKDY